MRPRKSAGEETCMADALGHSPDRSASTIRNASAAIAVLLLALAPQLFELAWSLAGLIFRFSGRNPLQVLFAHGSALLSGLPGLAFGSFGANGKTALSSDVLLA